MTAAWMRGQTCRGTTTCCMCAPVVLLCCRASLTAHSNVELTSTAPPRQVSAKAQSKWWYAVMPLHLPNLVSWALTTAFAHAQGLQNGFCTRTSSASSSSYSCGTRTSALIRSTLNGASLMPWLVALSPCAERVVPPQIRSSGQGQCAFHLAASHRARAGQLAYHPPHA